MAARKTQLLVQPIDNWTPVQDIVAVNRISSAATGQDGKVSLRHSLPKPDRLFACVGKGSDGVITEFRYGVEARIGLHFDCEVPISQVWALPFDRAGNLANDGTLFLLSVGASSYALALSSDEEAVEAVPQELLTVDLEHHTIAAGVIGEHVVQVTVLAIIVASREKRYVSILLHR